MKEKIGNLNFDFKETYNNEVTPERIKKLEAELQNINTIEAKLDFLKSEKLKYLNQITPEILEVSGRVDLPNLKNKPLFFDRIIQNYIDDLETRNEKNNSTKTTPSLESNLKDDALELIDDMLQDRFLTIEKKATIDGSFNTNIRCAAFCELLYDKGYLKKAKNKRIKQNDFAKKRYGINIESALKPSKKVERKKHIDNKVHNQQSLKSCFQ
jgi:hypothetical protein